MTASEQETAHMYRLLDLWRARRLRPGWERRAEALRLAFKAAVDAGGTNAAGTGPQEE